MKFKPFPTCQTYLCELIPFLSYHLVFHAMATLVPINVERVPSFHSPDEDLVWNKGPGMTRDMDGYVVYWFSDVVYAVEPFLSKKLLCRTPTYGRNECTSVTLTHMGTRSPRATVGCQSCFWKQVSMHHGLQGTDLAPWCLPVFCMYCLWLLSTWTTVLLGMQSVLPV